MAGGCHLWAEEGHRVSSLPSPGCGSGAKSKGALYGETLQTTGFYVGRVVIVPREFTPIPSPPLRQRGFRKIADSGMRFPRHDRIYRSDRHLTLATDWGRGTASRWSAPGLGLCSLSESRSECRLSLEFPAECIVDRQTSARGSGSVTALPVSIGTGATAEALRKSNPMTSAPSRRRISRRRAPCPQPMSSTLRIGMGILTQKMQDRCRIAEPPMRTLQPPVSPCYRVFGQGRIVEKLGIETTA